MYGLLGFIRKMTALQRSVRGRAWRVADTLILYGATTSIGQCKLAVLTWNSILDPQSFRESSFEFRGLRVEFWDTQGSRTEISRKWFHSRTTAKNKTIDAWLYSRKLTFECMQIFFHVVHFLYKTHVVPLSTLKPIPRWQQTNLASISLRGKPYWKGGRKVKILSTGGRRYGLQGCYCFVCFFHPPDEHKILIGQI